MATPRVTLNGSTLLRDGRPLVIVGGEIHNSSSSSVSAIQRSFRATRELGANTVLAPVAWDQLEPEEGAFDFSLVDHMVHTATELGLFLIPLWFGSWKNGISSYVPAWVKRDTVRFPRVELRHKGPVEVLSPFADASRAADAAAFGALMARIKVLDSAGVVVMAQVENEVGILGDARDRCALAEHSWRSHAPRTVIEAVAGSHTRLNLCWKAAGSHTQGTWADVFESMAEEAFMAAAFASYLESVTQAGRAQYDIPMYTNAWLDVPVTIDLPVLPAWAAMAGGAGPGFYPSGGPLAHVAPIWRQLAPSLDFLAPDIYFGDFDKTCRRFAEASDGRLFIPETRRSPDGVGQMFLALAEHRAIGVAPFGVDSLPPASPDYEALTDGYHQLTAVADIMAAHPDAATRGFVLSLARPSTQLHFSEVTVHIESEDPSEMFRPTYPAYGCVVQIDSEYYMVIGRGFSVSFTSTGDDNLGLLSVAEHGGPTSDEPLRRLGGDETGSGKAIRLPALNAVTPDLFPIPFDMRSTGILEVRLYRFPGRAPEQIGELVVHRRTWERNP